MTVAIEDRTRLLSAHWFNKMNPSCLSGFQPNAETAFKILAGNADKTK